MSEKPKANLRTHFPIIPCSCCGEELKPLTDLASEPLTLRCPQGSVFNVKTETLEQMAGDGVTPTRPFSDYSEDNELMNSEPLDLDTLNDEQQEKFLELMSVYSDLLETGVDGRRLRATLPR